MTGREAIEDQSGLPRAQMEEVATTSGNSSSIRQARIISPELNLVGYDASTAAATR